MVDFSQPYMTPMEQEYHPQFRNNDKRSDNMEEPLFPISSIGMTVPEIDQSGRARNIVEGVDAAFRAGAGNIQIVMQVPGQTSGIGGGPKAYGEEVRQAIREIQEASGAKVTGVELPTQINNLSGYTQQGFSEEQRKVALDEVRDAIKFVGDISGGGGVDLVSWEFARDFNEADWAKKEGKLFKQRGEETPKLVDTTSGRIVELPKREKIYLNRDPKTFQETEETKAWTWNDFENYARHSGQPVEKAWIDEYQNNQIRNLDISKNNVEYNMLQAKEHLDAIKQREEAISNLEKVYSEAKREGKGNEAELRALQHELEKEKRGLELAGKLKSAYEKQQSAAKENLLEIERQQAKLEEDKNKFQLVSEFGLNKAVESYSQAGIWAMQESQKNHYVQKGKGSIHIGPEMGWPQYYGSHPQEWVELILESRRKMTEDLVRQGYKENEAEDLSRKHIKGEIDTAHMGMWLQNFKPELPWDQRVKEFKGWYKKQIEYLAEQNKEHDLIGGIQIVDSASGAHGHLPPGQGILGKDIFDYMKILKEKGGYEGEFTSEGHEEEKFGQGRILTKAWEAMKTPVGSGYLYQKQIPQFRDVSQGYAQIAYGTTGIFQSYVPSNDFTMWSNVPLE